MPGQALSIGFYNPLIMKTINKKRLTRRASRSIVQTMPTAAPSPAKRIRSKPSQAADTTVEDQYAEFFVPKVSPLWAKDEHDYSLEQPSPLRFVPTETSYMDGGIVYPPTFA